MRPARVPGTVELLFVRRHSDTPVLGGAVVFPGGKLEPSDRDVGDTTGIHPQSLVVPGFANDADHALALAVCACRESAEEARLLPVTVMIDPACLDEIRDRLLRGESFRSAGNALPPTARIDTASLVPFARWITPIAEARRYDARFFLARAPQGQIGEVDRRETVGIFWDTPANILDAFDRGTVFLAPPTLRSVELLGEVRGVDEAFELASKQTLQPICPRFVPGEAPMLVLPGDPLHDNATKLVSGSTRFVLRAGRFASERLDALPSPILEC